MNATNDEIKILRAKAAQTFGHARACKKAPDDCAICQHTMAWYAALPAATLARVLAE